MTYRSDDAAMDEHLASEELELERARREHGQLTEEIAQLTARRGDLDTAIRTTRGSALSGRGWLRLAGVMVVILAASALTGYVRHVDEWAGRAVMATVVSAWGFWFWRAERRQKAAQKLLDAHDAQMAARAVAGPSFERRVPQMRVAHQDEERESDEHRKGQQTK